MSLGTDHKRRLALRERLKAVRLTCPLFDTRRWVAGWSLLHCCVIPLPTRSSSMTLCVLSPDHSTTRYRAATIHLRRIVLKPARASASEAGGCLPSPMAHDGASL